MELKRALATFLLITFLALPAGKTYALASSESFTNETSISLSKTTEDKIIIKLQELKKNMEEVFTKENVDNTKAKLKENYDLVVNFFFNDGEIEGKKFDDLTLEAKIKASKILIEIDEIVTKYFPHYKEDWANAVGIGKQELSDAYKFFKSGLMDFITRNYNLLKDHLSSIELNNLKILISDLKALGLDAWQNTKEKVPEIWQDIKEKTPEIWEDIKSLGTDSWNETKDGFNDSVDFIQDIFKKNK